MSLFASDTFLLTLGEVWFPGRAAAVEVGRLGGRLFRVLVVDGREVVTRLPFYDFVAPHPGAWSGPVRSLDFLHRTVLHTTTVEERTPERDGQRPSPYVDWSRFADWAAFEAFVSARIGNLFPDSRRRRRKLERDLGPLRFTFDDPRPEALEKLLEWKSAQYRATGLADLFADPRNTALFARLRERGLVVLSTLAAGDTLVAAHLGGLCEGQHAWWVPAYDAALARYSPGRLMLEDILRDSQARGHRELDFLIGDEDYKFHYATHNRVIGPLGTPPLRERVEAEVKRRARAALDGHPRLLAWARAARRGVARLRR